MVSLYTTSGGGGGDTATKYGSSSWVRALSVSVLAYEGVVCGALDYDYAPVAQHLAGKRVYLNVSQEARADVEALRQTGLLEAVTLNSVGNTTAVALRPTARGTREVEKWVKSKEGDEGRAAIEALCFAPGTASKKDGLVHVAWQADSGRFRLHSASGWSRYSTVTEVESVSYVSSPYLPQPLREWGRPTSSYADRVGEMKYAEMDIRDASLDEQVLLHDVYVLVAEWVPTGGNQIVTLNDKLGSSERIQGGFFISRVDSEPQGTQFRGEKEGMTSVNLLDYNETYYVNFEAEVYFPIPPGVVQIESFGCHFSEAGLVAYGLHVDAIMDRVKDRVSLDLLSRLIIDVHEDTSRVVENLLSPSQRAMLNLAYHGEGGSRDKYTLLFAEALVCPLLQQDGSGNVGGYLDGGPVENELRQVLGEVRTATDLSDGEVIILGSRGMLIAGNNAEHGPSMRLEGQAVIYAALQARCLFLRRLHHCVAVLSDVLKDVRSLLSEVERDPNRVGHIRDILSTSAEQVILLGETHKFLEESLDEEGELGMALADAESDNQLLSDEAASKLSSVLRNRELMRRLQRRVRELAKVVDGAGREVDAVTQIVDVVASASAERSHAQMQASTHNLEGLFRANERTSTSLEIMQVVLAGTLAFDVLDRLSGQYLGVAPDIAWAYDVFLPVLNVPGAWLTINLGVWAILAVCLLAFMRHVAFMNTAVASMRLRLNRRLDPEALAVWLATKKIVETDADRDEKTEVKKYSWKEATRTSAPWRGDAPLVEVLIDERFGFLLEIYFQINRRKAGCGVDAVRDALLDELDKARVFHSGPPGAASAVLPTAKTARMLSEWTL